MGSSIVDDGVNTMLALRAHQGTNATFLDTIDIPKLGPEDVLIRIASAGLSPGVFTLLDRGEYKVLPMTLGHEGAGTVSAVGNAVSSFTAGDRVRIYPSLSCRTCKYCRSNREQMCSESALLGFSAFGKGPLPLYEKYHDGCLAQYVRAPYWLVDRLPDNVSFDVGAKLQDFATAMHALRSANLTIGSTVIIAAATGSMGTATLKLADFFPISKLILIGRSSERLEAVRKLTRLPTEIVALADLGEDWPSTKALARKLRQLVPSGVDAIIDYTPSGNDIWQMMGGLATDGTLVHVGGSISIIPLPAIAIMVNCWKIVGVRANTREDSSRVLELLADGRLKVDNLITHRCPLSEAKDAITMFRSRSQPVWMSIINP